MSDLISRQDAINAVIAEGRSVDSRYLEAERIVHESDAVEALSMLPSADILIDDAPTIDVVPVVRCKDCKNRNENCGMGEHRWCEIINMSTRADDYCSYGKRREP